MYCNYRSTDKGENNDLDNFNPGDWYSVVLVRWYVAGQG